MDINISEQISTAGRTPKKRTIRCVLNVSVMSTVSEIISEHRVRVQCVLTRSSPRVLSASSSGSPGAWMVTDLSALLLLSLLFERCLSLRSLTHTSHKTHTLYTQATFKMLCKSVVFFFLFRSLTERHSLRYKSLKE